MLFTLVPYLYYSPTTQTIPKGITDAIREANTIKPRL
jgi:hypothetical protein